jgi:hypothetical protein
MYFDYADGTPKSLHMCAKEVAMMIKKFTEVCSNLFMGRAMC